MHVRPLLSKVQPTNLNSKLWSILYRDAIQFWKLSQNCKKKSKSWNRFTLKANLESDMRSTVRCQNSKLHIRDFKLLSSRLPALRFTSVICVLSCLSSESQNGMHVISIADCQQCPFRCLNQVTLSEGKNKEGQIPRMCASRWIVMGSSSSKILPAGSVIPNFA